jgi:hypothetical protein
MVLAALSGDPMAKRAAGRKSSPSAEGQRDVDPDESELLRGTPVTRDVICPDRTMRALLLVLILLLVMICAACSGNLKPGLTYQPDFLPVNFNVTASGVSIGGNRSLVTPIGTFSIGASYELLPRNDSIYVILRNRRAGYDRIFAVRSGSDQFSAIVNGTTKVSVSNGQVIIDVTAGKIKKITFKRMVSAIPEGVNPNWAQRVWHDTLTRWDEGWRQSWYKPYALTRWAYDDSTIGRWYGVGFIWFLLRLILAIICCFIDTALSLGFLLGQLGFVCFGPTGRNVIYGLLILTLLALVAAWNEFFL